MIKRITLIFISLIIFLSLVSYEHSYLMKMDKKTTELKNNCDIIETENRDLVIKINSIMAFEKLNKIAKEKNFLSPKESDIINIE